eukprot:TRINITY_DN77454_c0_g1_i1.p1 TRINITY_DN77454_c0_g1~~TRINITY_DN77454_c0_g1_i1.p1  ORF type:complete len:496 (+),score=62.35 TRINITY_DN77454_c0_g1_i1:134-1621(+)
MASLRRAASFLASFGQIVAAAPPRLTDWMADIMPVLPNTTTLLDLSVPGTHDSMSYDLSDVVSDGGVEDHPFLSKLLHWMSTLGIAAGDYIRDEAKTQHLDITAQLDNGVRFIDFRVMLTSPIDRRANHGGRRDSFVRIDGAKDWYCLHMVQSVHPAITYLAKLKAWLVAHPGEVVTLWMTRHGNGCLKGGDQYPDVSEADKRMFWDRVVDLFNVSDDGSGRGEHNLLINHADTPLNSTSLADLVARNTRLAIFAADFEAFTGSSPLAADGCSVDNQLGSGVDDEEHSYANEAAAFATAGRTKTSDKAQGRFYLRSMATSTPAKQAEEGFWLRYVLPSFATRARRMATASCARSFNLTNMTAWCPQRLLEISWLTNFYKQLSLEQAYITAKGNTSKTDDAGFPHAIYIDAVDTDGTIRTGTELDGIMRGYAYADTIIAYNVRRGCAATGAGVLSGTCKDLVDGLEGRRAQHPLHRWYDVAHGRQPVWPVLLELVV